MAVEDDDVDEEGWDHLRVEPDSCACSCATAASQGPRREREEKQTVVVGKLSEPDPPRIPAIGSAAVAADDLSPECQ